MAKDETNESPLYYYSAGTEKYFPEPLTFGLTWKRSA